MASPDTINRLAELYVQLKFSAAGELTPEQLFDEYCDARDRIQSRNKETSSGKQQQVVS